MYINVKDFGAKGDGIIDDTKALQECIYRVQEEGKTIYLPEGDYRVKETLLLGSKECQKPFKIKGTLNTRIITNEDICLARTNTNGKVLIEEISFVHHGQKGSALNLDYGFGHRVRDCSFSNAKGNTDSVLIFNGSYTDIVSCSIGNSEPEAYSIQCTSIPNKININSNIFDNRIHGVGKGLLIDSSKDNRPEGLKVSRNMFLNVGKEQVTVQSILHLDLSNNMIDQASQYSILLDPKMQGLCGIFISGNYISPAKNQKEGIGIMIKDRGLLTLTVNINNNMIAYSGYGLISGKDTVNLSVLGNAFNDIAEDAIVLDNTKGAIVTSNSFWICKRDVVCDYEGPVIENNQRNSL